MNLTTQELAVFASGGIEQWMRAMNMVYARYRQKAVDALTSALPTDVHNAPCWAGGANSTMSFPGIAIGRGTGGFQSSETQSSYAFLGAIIDYALPCGPWAF